MSEEVARKKKKRKKERAEAELEGEYEFNQDENRVVHGAASWVKALAFTLFAQAVLKVLDIAKSPVLAGATIIVYAVLGGAFLKAGQSLSEVVDTQGSDVSHMMHALQELGRAFQIRIIAMVLAAAALAVAIVLVVVSGPASLP